MGSVYEKHVSIRCKEPTYSGLVISTIPLEDEIMQPRHHIDIAKMVGWETTSCIGGILKVLENGGILPIKGIGFSSHLGRPDYGFDDQVVLMNTLLGISEVNGVVLVDNNGVLEEY